MPRACLPQEDRRIVEGTLIPLVCVQAQRLSLGLTSVLGRRQKGLLDLCLQYLTKLFQPILQSPT